MALSPSDVRWYKTADGSVTSLAHSGVLHDVAASIAVGASTDYTLLALVNDHASLTLSSAVVYLAVGANGVALAIAKASNGVVGKHDPLESAAASSLTYSSPTTVGAAISLGSIGPGQAVGVWLRRTASGATVAAPEINQLIVFGTSPI